MIPTLYLCRGARGCGPPCRVALARLGGHACTWRSAARAPRAPGPVFLRGTATSSEAKERVWHLPEWAKQEPRPPMQLRLLGFGMLVPLAAGSLAVHLLVDDDSEAEDDLSRVALNWSLHYAGALLSCAGALHWGMQVAELGVPKRSDYMGLYYLMRFSGPVVFVFFGWLGSVLTTALPVEASLWLLTGFTGLLSADWLAKAFRVAPAWWFRWRAGFNLSAMGCILILLLSERNLYLGQKPKIRM